MHPMLKYFINTFACDEARNYVYRQIEDYGYTDQELWETCNRPEWMMWMLHKLMMYHTTPQRQKVVAETVRNVMVAAQQRTGVEPVIKNFEQFDEETYSVFAGTILYKLATQQGLSFADVCGLVLEQHPQLSALVDQCVAARELYEREMEEWRKEQQYA